MHPLTPNLSELSLDELQNKYNDLTKKMLMAQRMGNSQLMNQVSMILDDYRNELSDRRQKLLNDTNNKANFKNIIDIS